MKKAGGFSCRPFSFTIVSMSYQTYTTEAIVCGTRDSYTSDRSYLLFTKDAGMLWASARSVRMEKSKQRFALQDFSIIRISLIKGKGGWRVGSVEAISNPFMEARERSCRTGVVALTKLLRRFVQGEEAHPAIFQDAVTALSCIAVAEGADIVDLQDQFTLRMLNTLGYIAPHDSYRDLILSADPWSVPQSLCANGKKAIEQALTASHL